MASTEPPDVASNRSLPCSSPSDISNDVDPGRLLLNHPSSAGFFLSSTHPHAANHALPSRSYSIKAEIAQNQVLAHWYVRRRLRSRIRLLEALRRRLVAKVNSKLVVFVRPPPKSRLRLVSKRNELRHPDPRMTGAWGSSLPGMVVLFQRLPGPTLRAHRDYACQLSSSGTRASTHNIANVGRD